MTAATPYERPYVVSSSLAPSRYKSIVKTTSSTQSQLRPDAKPFVLSNPTGTEEQMTELEAEIESANPSEELYTLWNFQERFFMFLFNNFLDSAVEENRRRQQGVCQLIFPRKSAVSRIITKN